MSISFIFGVPPVNIIQTFDVKGLISMSNDHFCLISSPSKLDPEGPAYEKMMKSKKFDPAKSAVLEVIKMCVIKVLVNMLTVMTVVNC